MPIPYTSVLDSLLPEDRKLHDIPVASPLDHDGWRAVLHEHPDRAFVERLLHGIKHGVNIDFKGDPNFARHRSRNHPSALEPGAHEALAADVAKDVAAGHTAGPFRSVPHRQTVVSPLGAVPKKGQPGAWRRIHDLSYPHGNAINDFIESSWTCEYHTFEEAVALVQRIGRGGRLCKVDIKGAFRLIPVRREDRHLLCFVLDGHLFAELSLPFGLSSSPSIFEGYSSAIEWALLQRNITEWHRWVDDYLIGGKTAAACLANRDGLLETFHTMGVPENKPKLLAEGTPATTAVHLGLLFDTESMTVSVTDDRLAELRDVVGVALRAETLTVKEAQTVVGKLNFAAYAVQAGRTYLRRLFDALRTAHEHRSYSVAITSIVRRDLQWWSEVLQQWPGRSLLLEPEWREAEQLAIFTDASLIGLGGMFGGKWFSQPWPKRVLAQAQRTKRVSTTFLELYALVTAASTWGHLWSGRKITFKCDNMPAVLALKAGTARDSRLMGYVRRLYLLAAQHSFTFKPEHLKGVNNGLADALSRFAAGQDPQQLQRFLVLHRQAGTKPDPSPTIPLWPSPLH